MIPKATVTLTAAAHTFLRDHLFPGDGKEAAAILICSRTPGPRLRLLVRDVLLVPHDECSRRTEHGLTWPGQCIEAAIDAAESEGLALILVHSHPSGYPEFSTTDDDSDQVIMPCIFEALGDMHGSAVMLPDGSMIARVYHRSGGVYPVDLVSMADGDLHYWWRDKPDRMLRPMAFTSDMTAELSRLTACVIGVSGTGSIMAEQACRLGFGRVLGIDHDHVEHKNLNRILNTNLADAKDKRAKVHAFSDRANGYRQSDYFTPIEANLFSRKAVLAAAQADVIYCCVDTHKGRMLADRLATSFLLPLFDVGVAIPTRQNGTELAIAEVTARIDYVRPGGSSLADRGVYTPATLQAEDLAESDPDTHAAQVGAGYIERLPEQAPSVITLNMHASSTCMMEFIARAYPFRHEKNSNYARTRFMLAEGLEEYEPEASFQYKESPLLARGDMEPLLGLPSLGPEEI
ncbi:ThiF family adenylyltransferase [Acidithiobacillus sp. HP-11]|uniref:ThiF family adenylyltransferase n=1 Tax=Acidithiobacillus sp. HP-11 TaxID=2697656 RepID=UPI001879E523|nr:ThiF family adenylyltransferase [Acidithiobacillus sp. HP-11]MBE7566645.1 ThiF family adenylyltransferase [Acidithiobacillus sp. HP-11]